MLTVRFSEVPVALNADNTINVQVTNEIVLKISPPDALAIIEKLICNYNNKRSISPLSLAEAIEHISNSKENN
jgi:hypothetical protein